MRRLLFIPIAFIVLVGVVVLAFNLGFLQNTLEKQASETLGGRVKFGKMTLVPLWPLSLTIADSHIEHAAFALKWKTLTVEVSRIFPPYRVKLSVVDPVFLQKGPFPESHKSGGSANGGSSAVAVAANLGLAVQVVHGDFTLSTGHAKDVVADFEQKQLLKSSARIHFKALVEGGKLPLPVAVSAASDNLTLTPEKVAASDLKVTLAGLNASAQGTSLLKEDRHHWTVEVDAPDLTKTPVPSTTVRRWRGRVRLKAAVAKEGVKSGWSAEGDLQADKVSADVMLKQDKLSVKGPFALDLQTNFSYSDAGVSIPKLNANADFTQTEIIYENVLYKTSGIPMKFTSQVQGDQSQIQIQDLQMTFWKANAKARGTIASRSPYLANLRLEVPSFGLTGVEKVFVPLSKQPAEGEVGMIVNYSGSLLDPKAARVLVDSLKVKNFSADVNYEKPGVFKIAGPVKANLEARADIDKSAVKQAAVKGRAILTDCALQAGPAHKPAKQILVADFQARNAANVVDVQNLSVDSFVGKLKLVGKISNIFDPTVQLRGELQNIGFSELREMLPEYRDKIPKGLASGTLTLVGKRAADKPWNEWPLAVSGDLRANLPEYAVATQPPAAPTAPAPRGKTASPSARANEAFLPSGYLTSHLNLKFAADVTTVKKEALVLRGVHSAGTISAGVFKGAVQIQQIFSGGLQLSSLEIPLLNPRPTIQGNVKWHDMVIEDALGFAKPEYREFAKGRTAGTADFQTYMPADPDFMHFLKARGNMTMQPVTLNSVKIGEMINELIKKAPMLKIRPVKMDPLKGWLKTDFDMRSEVLQLTNLHALDDSGSEIQLRGKVVASTMQGDFVGDFFWAKPQVQGCLLEGNSDAKGRMAIPVAIKGDLMHPGLSLISDMVSKLGGKALECEKKKLVDQLKKDGGRKLEEEGKKLLKGLFGH